ncbi:MAG: YdcF family protein, partial [Verrucomicrobiota bacterium]
MPTWRGWLVLLAVIGLGGVPSLRALHDFLAFHSPVAAAEALVVEGWAPDYVFVEALHEFRTRPYKSLYVTGGPIDKGAPLSEYQSYAELGAAMLRALGCDAS